MTPPSKEEHPEFVTEALADDGAVGGELPAFQDLFPALDVGTGAARLLKSVSELPLRYAPFFSRIAELWDVEEEAVVTVLERAKDATAWRNPGLSGLRVIDVQGGPRTEGAEVHLVRFAPGMAFPRHRHPGPETLLVLEGDYTDSEGHFVGPGDVHLMSPGSVHSIHVGKGGPCVAASVQAGREFTGAFMRLLAKLRS